MWADSMNAVWLLRLLPTNHGSGLTKSSFVKKVSE